MNRNVHKAHICILLSILVMLTSCGKTTPHEVSHRFYAHLGRV